MCTISSAAVVSAQRGSLCGRPGSRVFEVLELGQALTNSLNRHVGRVRRRGGGRAGYCMSSFTRCALIHSTSRLKVGWVSGQVGISSLTVHQDAGTCKGDSPSDGQEARLMRREMRLAFGPSASGRPAPSASLRPSASLSGVFALPSVLRINYLLHL